MILFIGDKPSKRTDPSVPFKGAACEKRLYEWIDKVSSKSHYYFIINKIDDDFIPMVNLAIVTDMPIIALGNNASKALGMCKHFKLPHPSGRNRQINNKKFIEAKLLKCKEFIERTL